MSLPTHIAKNHITSQKSFLLKKHFNMFYQTDQLSVFFYTFSKKLKRFLVKRQKETW